MSSRPRNPAFAILAVTLTIAGLAYYFVGQTDPDDISGRMKGSAVLIVIAAGVLVLVFALRHHARRLRRHAELEVIRGVREAAAAGNVDDPAKLGPDALFVILATKEVDENELARASSWAWGIAQRSQNTATYMTVLVIVLMTPALLLQNVKLIVLAAIPIVAYAVYLAIRVVMPGGDLDEAYRASDSMLGFLELATRDRPQIIIVPRLAGDGAQKLIVGPTVLGGKRHGREVEVSIDGADSYTQVAGSYPQFELRGKSQRLIAQGAVPAAARQVLEPLKASPYWTGVKVQSGSDGIRVQRKATVERRWLYDLWLAERLAAAL
jgi:hypothetical protein